MIYQHIKNYFIKSEERNKALFLLAGGVASVLGLVWLTAAFAAGFADFTDALMGMDMPLFMQTIQSLLIYGIGYAGFSSLKYRMLGNLAINWRKWLTKDLKDKYISEKEKNYLELSRNPDLKIDNPAQRIQDDVYTFVNQSIFLSFDLLEKVLTQATFISTLWVVGGSLDLVLWGTSMTIPGYLVWMAIGFSAVTNLMTHYVGGALSKLTHHQQGLEAEFRKEMELVSHDAESIAQDHGENYYQQSLAEKFKAVFEKEMEILQVRMRLTAFQSFLSEITSIFPYMMAAPLYFAKKTSYAQLMQIGWSFQQIQSCFSWFSNSYESLAAYHASVTRISELENAMSNIQINAALQTQAIHVETKRAKAITVDNLEIFYPNKNKSMMKGLSCTFLPGEHTIIRGRSGLGKSTTFKAVAGTWRYGNGTITVPRNETMCFLPQRPSLPNDTLKAVLAYPDPVETYTDEQYTDVLHKVGLKRLVRQLDKKSNWSAKLSLGEQERVSFARALLKKPDWLFLDEATASLDTNNERRMYTLIKSNLPNTTFISIAHRPTVTKYHQRVIDMKRVNRKNGMLIFKDVNFSSNASDSRVERALKRAGSSLS